MTADLLIATNNAHKIEEFRLLLHDCTFRILQPSDVEVSLQVAETGMTFAANATLKADAFCALTGITTLADDSGLVVDALDGAPGVYSARYGGPDLNDSDRTNLVLKLMGEVPWARRTARFVAAIAIARIGRNTIVNEAEVDGIIAREPRGTHGFGYDPIFYYPPAGKTFAEMLSEEKAGVSHRGKAVAKTLYSMRNGDLNDILT